MIDAGAVRCPICGGRKKPRKAAPRCRCCRGKGYVMVERRAAVDPASLPGPTGATWIDWGSDTTGTTWIDWCSDTTGTTWWNSAVATTGRAC